MTVRFLADEDIGVAFIAAIRALEPRIDVLDVKASELRGTRDVELLEIAFRQNRIVLTHDRNSMIREFRNRVATGRGAAGLCVFSQDANVADLAEHLLLIWAASSDEEWIGRIEYLPF